MPTPGVYICIRRTLDWHDETASAARLRPDFRPKAEAWNATLDPPAELGWARPCMARMDELMRQVRLK
jgi:hypothetical protein